MLPSQSRTVENNQQISNDTVGGATVEHDKGRTMAIGPAIWYKQKFALQTMFETQTQNRPQGATYVGWIA